MKRLLITLMLLFTAGAGLNAQLLYRISGKDLKQDSYLFGTIHIMPKDNFQVSPQVMDAIKTSSTIAMEIDMNISLSDQMELIKLSTLPEGKTLKDFMTDTAYGKLKSYCMDSVGWNEAKFNRFSILKPIFFSSLVLQEKMGKQKSFEEEFKKIGKKQGKRLMGLETMKYQMETMDRISIENQVKYLDSLSSMAEFNELFALYQKEDISALHAYISRETASIPDFNHWFLDVRNTNWIPVIEKQIAAEPTFIAVGAGHLGGPAGVIELLRNQGYTVSGISK
ncbi:MAG: hypothetical protein RLZZ370_1395 [Bacteroidota bacterium]|jgi:uncharacterized protein YbaP (TraB family)